MIGCPRGNGEVHDEDVRTAREVHEPGAGPSLIGAKYDRHAARVYAVSQRRDVPVRYSPAVQTWLATHPQVRFHFTPTGASWLNLVEAWFSLLTRKSVRRGSFDTVRALIRHIERYLVEWNAHPTPFVWTKEPADIIKKALRRAH